MRRTDPRSGPLTLDPSPFVHLNDAAEFARFDRPDHVKVAWAVRCVPWGERETRIEFEVRVDATDEAAWRKFRHYFRLHVGQVLPATPKGDEGLRDFVGARIQSSEFPETEH